jgi:hypothetical protein
MRRVLKFPDPAASNRPAPIGHNGGPPFDVTWTAWVWRRAHAEAWKSPGREIVMLRLRRAGRLGLGYRDYTSVILDRGVHLGGLIIVVDGALLQFEAEILRKLDILHDCAIALWTDGVSLPGSFHRNASHLSEAPVDDAALAKAMRGLCARTQLTPSQFCMIGTKARHARAAMRAGVGLFLPASEYFAVPLP